MARQTVHLHYRIFPEDHLWVGECLELGVSTSATSEAEARQGIDEATRLYLDTLAEQGELQHVLAERGIAIVPEDAPSLGTLVERTIALPAGIS